MSQKIIANELSGVFNWVLDGLKRLLENKKFTESNRVKLAREQYEKESDSVKLFIEEKGYQPDAISRIAVSKLYSEYRSFCLEDGYQPVNKMSFKTRLKNCKIVVEKKNIGLVAFLTQTTEGEYKNFG